MPTQNDSTDAPESLAGGGEMGDRIRAFDWSRTPVGAFRRWPASLRTLVRMLLECRMPMYIAWGPEFTQFYNDAYRPILGDKHVDALGADARHTWPEIWDTIGPMWQEVLQGKPIGFDNFKLTIERYGYPEDCYFNFSYSPVRDDDGAIAGVMVTFVETTGSVLTARRLAFQLQCANQLRELAQPAEVAAAAAMLLGRTLGASRVGYGEIDPAQRTVRVERDWTDGSVASLAGEARELDSFGPMIIAELRAGRVLKLDDIAADPRSAPYAAGYASIGTRSLLVVPLVRAGRFSAILYVHEPAPRQWRDEDVSLALALADQTWEAVERARVQQELQDSEDHYRHAVELNPEVQWTAAADGRVDRISGRWTEWTGSKGLHDGWVAALHPDDRDRAAAAWRDCVADGRPYDVELRVRMRGGEYAWVHVTAYPRRDAAGAIVKWYGTTRNINAYKLAQEALSQQEQEFRTLAQAVPNHTWVADAQGRITWCNDRTCAYLGKSPADIAGEGWTGVVHPEDLQRSLATWSGALRGGHPYENEFRLREGRSGHYRWFIARALPVRAGDGAVERWIGTNTDVHEQKTYAAQLAHLNRSLEQEVATRTADRDRMWRLSTDIMLVARFDSTIVAINPAWQEMLGWSGDALIGRPFLDLVHPDDLAATVAEGARLEQGIKTLHFENRYRHRDGSYRWLEWTAVPDASYIHAVARDVTLEKEREEALRQAEHALRQTQKLESVGKLTGGVAHDFNNILQVVSGNLQLLQDRVGTDEPASRRLATAMAAVDRGAKLSSQLLAFARRQPLQPAVVDPGRIMRGMEDLLVRTLGGTIAVETVIGAGLWNAQLDPHQLENVILNLAINARDAMPGGGRLTMEVGNAVIDDDYALAEPEAAAGQYVLFAVSDTGTGMAPEVLEQACEPFFTTKPEGQGTGLGLSMAYGFVKQSGGHFKIYSEVGQGTTVRLYFPRARGQERPVAEAVPPPAAGGAETILVVEDDPSVQATVVAMLGDLGYRVLRAGDADTALTVLQSGVPIDLLFTDVVMPGRLRSPELARQARLLHPGIAVLFTSGYTQNAIVHGGRLDPGVHLISKPYRRESLARKIRQLLGGQAEPAPAQKRILVVEDARDTLELTCELLRAMGHHAEAAEDGEAALHALAAGTFHIMITDVGLPGMSGIELAGQARRLHPALRIVLSSGYGTALAESTEVAHAVLPKPYDMRKLEAVIARLG